MKKIVLMFACILVLSSVFCACSRDDVQSSRTVTDQNKNVISLPEEVKLAASNSASVTSQIVMLAGADSIAIAPKSFSTGHTETFEDIFEGTKEIELSEGNKISAETLLSKNVDVFFTTKQNEADEYTKAGITCVVLNFDTVDNIAQSFCVIGEIFGGEAKEKGEKISAHILEAQKIANEKKTTLSDKDVKSVYYIAASTQTTPLVSQGEGTSTAKLLEMCGAEHITSGKGLDVTVTAEFLLEKDPDIIIIDGYKYKEAYDELINDPVLKELTAVKENKIIFAPIGVFRPYMRPGAETGLGLLWLTKTLCPDYEGDILLKDEAKKFYHDCFDWEISDDEIEKLFYGAVLQ